MAHRAEDPTRVVFDAGPLIGAFNDRDAHHGESSRGLSQLVASRTRLYVPVPIVFEVYKWLAYRVRPSAAHRALSSMCQSFEIVAVDHAALLRLLELVEARSSWPGSLEDAALALAAYDMDAMIWTYNYRDLAAFTGVEFWTPA